MEAQEGTPNLDQAADKTIKSEQQQSITSSSVLPSSDSGSEVREEKNKEKPVCMDSSLTTVRTTESSSASINKGEVETASRDVSSTLSAPSSVGSVGTKNIYEGSVEGKAESKSAVSSVPLANPTEGEKAKKRSHDSIPSTMPTIYAAEVTEMGWTKVVRGTFGSLPRVGIDRIDDGKEVKADITLVRSPFEEAVQVAPLAIVSSIQSVSADSSQRAIRERIKSNKDGKNDSITVSSRPATIGTEFAETSGNEMTQTETAERLIPPEKELEGEEIDEVQQVELLSNMYYRNVPETVGRLVLMSGSYENQETNERTGRRITRQDSREPCRCLCIRYYYAILAVTFLIGGIGLITHLLPGYGIGPEVLRPIGASTIFLSLAVFFFSGLYLSYLGCFPQLPVVPAYELMGDVDSVMAINRITNPERYCNDDNYVSRSRISRTSPEKGYRETQFADVSGSTGTFQTEGKMRLPGECGPPGLAHASERLKTGLDEVMENISVPKKDGSINSRTDISSCNEQDMKLASNGIIFADTTQSTTSSTAEQTSDSQSSDEYAISDTSALLAEKR